MDSNTQNWLSNLVSNANAGIEQIGVGGFLVVMLASMLSSFLIAALYLKFYGSRATGSQIHRSFPLIGMSVTAIFICIQFSLPLSLGLLGALSIVRFRTPIKEPEEIGFIMLVIAASIAISTFSLNFLLILLMFAILALYLQRTSFRFTGQTHDDGMMLLSLPSGRYQVCAPELRELLDKELIRARVESVSKSGENSVISYSFRGLRSDDPVELQLAVSRFIGEGDVNVYLNKQATL